MENPCSPMVLPRCAGSVSTAKRSPLRGFFKKCIPHRASVRRYKKWVYFTFLKSLQSGRISDFFFFFYLRDITVGKVVILQKAGKNGSQ